jgi:hypothetical protein
MAIRNSLPSFVEELVSELGPSDEAEVARYSELFAVSAERCREAAVRSDK